MGSVVLLDLMGGVALLLWGLHMVRSGIMRAFGSGFRRFLGTALHNRFLALLAGIGVTALLQSSTATGLLMTSFAARGLVELVPGLAVMLGANIGTTLIVQALSFDVSALAPVLFLVGLLAFNFGGRTITRDLGRVAIGLGLMLLSLHILIDTLAPAETAPSVRIFLGAITAEPVLCVLFAAALTWAAHSSAAVVLLVMSLAYSHFVSPVAVLALVLGANLGSAINPLLEGSHANLASRRLPVGNMLNRAVGVVLVLPFLQPITEIFMRFDPNPARMAADFHTIFNVALALIFVFLLDGVARLLVWLLPEPTKQADPFVPLYLDEAAISSPSVALACAARETLHMGDVIEVMLKQAMTALLRNDRKLVAEVSRMDNIVDRLDEAIKLYVTKLTRESLDEREGARAMEIIAFAINLEHIGDIIDKNLMELAAKKIKHKYEFSKEGAAELETFHKRIVENLKFAFSVFINQDVPTARKLIEEKTQLRVAELGSADSHLARLREGRPESIETSSLHLDILRDLKRIHSHVCSVAYPVLEAAGELQPNRLKDGDTSELLPLSRPPS
ncbi:MAG: Na/Pi cotransporter family protein [Xanthobacteraceae bacterium]|jgi:phosphate:Na+ symporter